MGNCFGKEEATSSSPTPAARPATNTPGRTLGGAGDDNDPRSAAARAAEQRASKTAGKGGKLQSQLDAQRKKTRTQTLGDASDDNRKARGADEAAEARNWN